MNGDKWSVKLDVRDLGGHLDTTKRHRASTLSGRVSGLLNGVLVVMALPLDFSVNYGSFGLSFCLVRSMLSRLLAFPSLHFIS